MRTPTVAIVAAVLALSGTAPLRAAAPVGQPAPEFFAADSSGRLRSLGEFKGRWVVLEWHNNGCPYVRKHYDSGNMQRLQQEWTAKGVAWLTVISSAPGTQGHVTAGEANRYAVQSHATPTAILLDPRGLVGRLYEAKTTPHMFVVNPQGIVVYNGAIDNRPSTDPSDVDGATNYVATALTDAMAGKPVSVAASRPYGCSIKYADR
jgi:hypothetical protein